MDSGSVLREGGFALPGGVAPQRSEPLAPLSINFGSLELLKWFALICMTVDHVNKYLLGGREEAMFLVGRLALPIFAVVLGLNLARSEGAALGRACRRTMLRLAAAGSLASVPFVALGGLGWGWWPLNIMFTFFVATAAIWLVGAKGWTVAAVAVVLVGGAFVEFWWPGVVLCVAAWAYARRPSVSRLIAIACACGSLTLLGWALARQPLLNTWGFALAALPVIWLVSKLDFKVPRLRLFFYLYYPAHLAVIWALMQGIKQ